MVLRNSQSELQTAWHALAGRDAAEGLRSIALRAGNGRFRAGVHAPGNEEALLLRFGQSISRASALPEGRGFQVAAVDPAAAPDAGSWFMIQRQPAADLSLFTLMAQDLVATLSASALSEERAFFLFLERIRAWQAFMEKPRSAALSQEEETGLFAELLFLEILLGVLPDATDAIRSWNGPLRHIHDFHVGNSFVEVKATASVNGFPVKVSSLDQLDSQDGSPLFLLGVRLSRHESGLTLPQIVGRLRDLLVDRSAARSSFEQRLMLAGYLDEHAADYDRKLVLREMKVFAIAADFPRLARSTTAPEIRDAQYEIDLDLVTLPAIDVPELLFRTGVSAR